MEKAMNSPSLLISNVQSELNLATNTFAKAIKTRSLQDIIIQNDTQIQNVTKDKRQTIFWN